MIRKLFSNKYFIILVLVTVLLVIAMIFSVNKSYETSASDNIIIKITMPVQRLVYNVSSGVRNFFSHFGDISEIRNVAWTSVVVCQVIGYYQ